jgi:1-aminocyclopropane-1-carboxylate deaminase/D-cysteine desulfhydrase-like pyridoxal-dependent ACC family enzyme
MAIIKPVDESKIFIQDLPSWGSEEQQISMLRLDAIHPIISGNKWFKLQYNLEAAVQQKCTGILTFGGAFSNHLIATAAAAQANKLSSIGMVRGMLDPTKELNPVLQQCQNYGMKIFFLSREDYAQKEKLPFLEKLNKKYPQYYIIPEGGANEEGRKGMVSLAQYIPHNCSHILLCVGSGTTFAGLRNALPLSQQLMGFAPMKGGNYLSKEIQNHIQTQQDNHWEISDQFHYGGFGKITEEVINFMHQFDQQYGFKLDRVYTAKMMMGLKQLLSEKAFPSNAKILCIHSGGLTGN